MNKIVFDASAIVALINNETGSMELLPYLKKGIISAVNFSEAVTCLTRANISMTEARDLIKDLLSEVIPYDERQALLTAEFKLATKKQGLSLGDCACLALAKLNKLPVLTADKIWSKINLDIEILFIR